MEFRENKFIDDKISGRRSITLSNHQFSILQFATSFVPNENQPEFLFKLGEALLLLGKKALTDDDITLAAASVLKEMSVMADEDRQYTYQVPRQIPIEWSYVPQSEAIH